MLRLNKPSTPSRLEKGGGGFFTREVEEEDPPPVVSPRPSEGGETTMTVKAVRVGEPSPACSIEGSSPSLFPFGGS
jgi:hypothetical protein